MTELLLANALILVALLSAAYLAGKLLKRITGDKFKLITPVKSSHSGDDVIKNEHEVGVGVRINY